MTINIKKIILLITIILLPYTLIAQTTSKNKQGDNKAIKSANILQDIKLKWGVSTQIWARFQETNPGTINRQGEAVDRFTDIGIRRARFSYIAYLPKKIIVYSQIGVNNMTQNQSIPELFIHDLWVKVPLYKNKTYLGYGLKAFGGLSRISNLSLKSQLLLDNPTFNFPAVNRNDHFIRQLGVFLQGSHERIGYHFSASNPYAYISSQLDNPPDNTIIDLNTNNLHYKGYLMFHFFDSEYTTASFYKMTHLGTKKMLNIGLGFDYQKEAFGQFENKVLDKKFDRFHFAFDVFSEFPIKANTFMNVYAVYYKYDFGPNYLRSVGIMNIFNAGATLPQGSGIKQYVLGTGSIFYFNLGLMKKIESTGKIIQPYAAYTYKDFEALPVKTSQFDLGINYMPRNQNLKWTLQYSARPIYEGTVGEGAIGKVSEDKGLIILQTQILISKK